MTALLISLIQLYRNSLTHTLLHSCRFFPTCSEYALFALERHGTLRGSLLAARRLLRCHPFARPGLDPVRQ